MANTVKNLTKATSNTINAASTTVAVTSQVLADTTGGLNKGIEATPGIVKELLLIPFSAASGVLQGQGMSKEEADKKAFTYVDQEVSKTIRDLSEGAGKLAADLFADEEDDVDEKQLMKHTKAELAAMIVSARNQ